MDYNPPRKLGALAVNAPVAAPIRSAERSMFFEMERSTILAGKKKEKKNQA